MRVLSLMLLLGGMRVPALAQEGAPEKAALHARVELLKKQVASADAPARLEALRQLGEIEDDEAIPVLAARLRADAPELRIAAARAIARHRKPSSALAIGAALDANRDNPEVLQEFISALAELDLCKGVPVLASILWLNKNALAEPALDALGKIGCPEAAGALVEFLRQSEAEARKPDVFEDDDGGTEDNRNKNKVLAGQADRARETLAAVLGRRFASAREASAWLGGEPALRLGAVYFCEAERASYVVPFGKPKKCGFPRQTSIHNDILLKHFKE